MISHRRIYYLPPVVLALVLVVVTGCGGSSAQPGFTLSVNPANQSIQAGSSLQWSLETTALHGFTGSVSVSLIGLPVGVTGPGALTLSPGTPQSITLAAASSTPAGSYMVTIAGRSGSQTQTLQMLLIVTSPPPDFSLSVANPALSLQAGSTPQSIQVTASPIYGFNSPVNVTLSGLPAGVSAKPSSLTLTPGVGTTVALAASDSAAVGSFTLTLTGTSGSLNHTISVNANVTAPANFTFSASQQNLSLTAGAASQSIQLTAAPLNGFNSPISVSVSGLPSGLTATPSSLTMSQGQASSLSFNASNSAAAGSSNVTITATSGSLTHSVTLAINVSVQPDFTLSVSPQSITIPAGSSSQFSLSAQAVNGWTAPVSVTVSGLPTGVSVTPSTFSLTVGTPQTLQITTTSIATAGNEGVTLTASAASVAHTTVMPLLVQPRLSLKVYPASFTLAPGLSQTLTVTTTDGSPNKQPIAATFQGLPPGIQATPASPTLTSGVAQQVTLTADSSFTADGTASLQATVDGAAQTQTLAFHALPPATTLVTNGLMAFYPMNEGKGSTIHDASGNGRTGTFDGTGNTWSSAGVTLNGNGWIDLPSALSSAQTIQMWVNVPAPQPGVEQTLIGTGGNGGVDSFVWAMIYQNLYLTYNGQIGTVAAGPFAGSGVVALAEGSSAASTLDQYWVNGTQAAILETTSSAVAGLPNHGFLEVGSAAGVNGLSGTVGPLALYDRALSPAEVAQNAAYFSSLEQAQNVQTQQANNAAGNQFIAMGDSITWGLGDGGTTYCSLLAEPSFYSICLGFIGETSDLGVQQAPQFANYYAIQGKYNILFDWYMSNDVEAGTPNAQILQNLEAACGTAKQLYPGWTTLIGTMMSRLGITDATRFALNDMIRQQTASNCDGYIDIAADPLLGATGAYAAANYFSDGVHPAYPGNQEIAGIITRYVNSLTGATAANPTVQSSSAYIMTTADNYVQASPASDGTWTLPECIGLTGKTYTIVNQGAGALSFVGSNGEAINGSATVSSGTTGLFQIGLTSDATGGCQWTRQ